MSKRDENLWRRRIGLNEDKRYPRNILSHQSTRPLNHTFTALFAIDDFDHKGTATASFHFTRRQSALLGIFLLLTVMDQIPVVAGAEIDLPGCTPEGTRFLQTMNSMPASPTSATVSSPKKTVKKLTNPGALSAELFKKKISVSRYAKKIYAKKSPGHTAAEDKQLVIETLLNLSKTSERIYCKLKMLFEDSPHFSIMITTQEDPLAAGREGFAKFLRKTNKILIFINQISNVAFSDMLLHEAQHAYVYYANFKNKYQFFETDNQIFANNSIPCIPIGTSADCKVISDILNAGAHKATALMSFIEYPELPLDPTQTLVYKRYLELITGYPQLVIDAPIDSSTIQHLKKQKLIDDHLKILDPSGYLKQPYHNGKQQAYVSNIQYRDGQFLGMVKTCVEPNSPKAPLLDMLYLFEHYEKFDAADKIKERDAVIHQLFAKYPELIDFLYPGLENFHFKRGGTEVEQCIMASRKS